MSIARSLNMPYIDDFARGRIVEMPEAGIPVAAVAKWVHRDEKIVRRLTGWGGRVFFMMSILLYHHIIIGIQGSYGTGIVWFYNYDYMTTVHSHSCLCWDSQ